MSLLGRLFGLERVKFEILIEHPRIEQATVPIIYGEKQTTEVLRRLLRLAAEKRADVFIITDDLPATIYDPLVSDLEKCLKARCDFRILTSAPPDDQHLAANRFLQTAIDPALQQGEVRQLAAEHRKIPHFMMVGDFGYWLRTDPEILEGSSCLADTGKIITPRLEYSFDIAGRAAGLGIRPAADEIRVIRAEQNMRLDS